jgi:hypothetical protein
VNLLGTESSGVGLGIIILMVYKEKRVEGTRKWVWRVKSVCIGHDLTAELSEPDSRQIYEHRLRSID